MSSSEDSYLLKLVYYSCFMMFWTYDWDIYKEVKDGFKIPHHYIKSRPETRAFISLCCSFKLAAKGAEPLLPYFYAPPPPSTNWLETFGACPFEMSHQWHHSDCHFPQTTLGPAQSPGAQTAGETAGGGETEVLGSLSVPLLLFR